MTKLDVKGLLELAQKALDEKDYIGVDTYCEAILQKEPMNWKAFFFQTYSQLANCKLGERVSAIDNYILNLDTVIKRAKSSCPDEGALRDSLQEIKDKTDQQLQAILNDANSIYPHILEKEEYRDTVQHCCVCYKCLGRFLEEAIPNGPMKAESSEMRKKAIKVYADMVRKLGTATNVLMNGGLTQVFGDDFAYIKEYDPAYEWPVLVKAATSTSTSSSSGGCYIATAVYGSYDCPEVWTLRRYRDYTLAETWSGRVFIRIYYAVSPTIVRWFGKTRWFNKIWRKRLDRLVARLQKEGVSSKPYKDL